MIRTKKLRLPFNFDVERLKQDLNQFSEDEWIVRDNRAIQNSEWLVLPLRSMEGSKGTNFGGSASHYKNTELLNRCPYFQTVLSTFKCDITSVRLISLKEGATVKEHTDSGFGYEDGIARLFISVSSQPEATFTLDGEEVHFPEGETWYVNANCPHAVHNRSNMPRVHMMLDLPPNPWLDDIFYTAGFQPDGPAKYGDPSITDANVDMVIAELKELNTSVSNQLANNLLEKMMA